MMRRLPCLLVAALMALTAVSADSPDRPPPGTLLYEEMVGEGGCGDFGFIYLDGSRSEHWLVNGCTTRFGDDGLAVVQERWGKRLGETNGGRPIVARRKYQVIDRRGEVIHTFSGDIKAVWPMGQTRFLVSRQDDRDEATSWTLVSAHGILLSSRNIAKFGKFDEYGYAPFKEVDSRKWGYMDVNGKVLCEPQYEEASDFEDGYAVVRDASTHAWSVLDQRFQVVFGPLKVKSLYHGLAQRFVAATEDEDGRTRYALLGPEGKVILKGLTSISSFYEGRAFVSYDEDGKAGPLIDTEGRAVSDRLFVPRRQYLERVGFADGFCPVTLSTGEFVYIDRNGNPCTQFPGPFIEEPGNFCEGRAFGKLKSGGVMFDRTGRVLYRTASNVRITPSRDSLERGAMWQPGGAGGGALWEFVLDKTGKVVNPAIVVDGHLEKWGLPAQFR